MHVIKEQTKFTKRMESKFNKDDIVTFSLFWRRRNGKSEIIPNSEAGRRSWPHDYKHTKDTDFHLSHDIKLNIIIGLMALQLVLALYRTIVKRERKRANKIAAKSLANLNEVISK